MIKDKEEILLKEWLEHDKEWLLKEGLYNEEAISDLFCPDGLHYTGYPDKTSGRWLINGDNRQDNLWNEQTIKPILLTKDHNHWGENEGVDNRTETGLKNDSDGVDFFHIKYLTLLYGLSKINKNGDYPSFAEASNADNYLKNFHHDAAVVRINAKKIAGGSECPYQLLDMYISHDKDFIIRQINLYQPNVIVCCDSTEELKKNPILRFLLEEYDNPIRIIYEDEEYNFLYYSPKYNIIIIHEWHPSRVMSPELYYRAVPHLARFIREHSAFLG